MNIDQNFEPIADKYVKVLEVNNVRTWTLFSDDSSLNKKEKHVILNKVYIQQDIFLNKEAP